MQGLKKTPPEHSPEQKLLKFITSCFHLGFTLNAFHSLIIYQPFVLETGQMFLTNTFCYTLLLKIKNVCQLFYKIYSI